jgi:CubicO group peptidase (beta-lactamase class C family)
MKSSARFVRAVFLVAVGLATGACSERASDDKKVVVSPIGKQLDDYLTRLSGFGYSGATLVAKDGRVILKRGYGFANDSTRAVITPTTVFDIGSLTKQFTAAAILKLEEQKQLSIDDSISKYIDGVPNDKQAITIRQLLSHTSGLDESFPYENMIGEDYEEVSRDDAVRRILAMPLISQPGTQSSYSNPGYVLLAAIVERASGRPFREYLRVELFAPAGMQSSGFWGRELPSVPEERLARSYSENGETANLRSRSSTTWFDQGGGEMVSTVEDLYAWFLALQYGRILSHASLEKMMSPAPSRFAMGWMIDTTSIGARRIHHGGDYIGFGAELAFFPDDSLVVVNLANRRNDILGTRYAADRVIPLIVAGRKPEVWKGEAFDVPPQWSAVLSERLRGAIGTYELPTGGKLKITAMGEDALSVAAEGQDAVNLLAPADKADLDQRDLESHNIVEVIQGLAKGDTTALAAHLHEGGDAGLYLKFLTKYVFDPDSMGTLQRIDVIGTVTSAFPRHSSNTMVRLHFDHGTKVWRFGWLGGKIQNSGLGWEFLAPTPLRASPTSDSLVGWNIIWARSIQITPKGTKDQITSLEFARPGQPAVLARRLADP